MAVEDIFKTVAQQMMTGTSIELDGKKIAVKRTSSQRLKMVTFTLDGEEFTAIEQNPEKPSRWGKLARDGHRVVQIKDVESNRFIAVVVDGEVKKYSR
jgi:hypothetical protein